MSEIEFIDQMKKLKSDLMRKIIVSIISGLFIMIIGGGWTMAKIFNVKEKADIEVVNKKADKEYVDSFYGDMMRIMENRTLVLEQMVKAEKERNNEKFDILQNSLIELDKKWAEHMKYHMEKTRSLNSDTHTYFGEDVSFLFTKK
jgi:hypothetical protein